MALAALGRAVYDIVETKSCALLVDEAKKAIRESQVVPKVRDAIRLVEKEGWTLVRTRGDHRQYHHPDRPGLVTVAGHPNDDLAPGTWNSILKQAGLKGDSR